MPDQPQQPLTREELLAIIEQAAQNGWATRNMTCDFEICI
jgi:hypothetical protein